MGLIVVSDECPMFNCPGVKKTIYCCPAYGCNGRGWSPDVICGDHGLHLQAVEVTVMCGMGQSDGVRCTCDPCDCVPCSSRRPIIDARPNVPEILQGIERPDLKPV